MPVISLDMGDRVVNEKSAVFRYMSKEGKRICLLGDEKSAKKRLGKQGQGWGDTI